MNLIARKCHNSSESYGICACQIPLVSSIVSTNLICQKLIFETKLDYQSAFSS